MWPVSLFFSLLFFFHFIFPGTEAQNKTAKGFPVEKVSASVSSVVAFIVLVTFVFFLRRFWFKKEDSKPDSEVSQVTCNQQVISSISYALGEGSRRGRLWDYFS